MLRIAEKVEFMKGRAVKVCAKAGIGRKVGHEKRVFLQIFKKLSQNRKILIIQDNFVTFIDVLRRNFVY
jgi:hypothetical protein